MTIQNQLVGAREGDSVHLDCHSEAFPRSINYWTINDQIISQCEYIHEIDIWFVIELIRFEL